MLQTMVTRVDRASGEIDRAVHEFETTYASGDGVGAISGLAGFLRDLRLHCSEPDWKSNCARLRETHAFHLLLNDPYTHRAFTKPRGYAGDAVMIDFIYNAPTSQSNDPAQQLHFYTTNRPAARAVRFRRQHIADCINALSQQEREIKVLAISAGHLRELDFVDKELTGTIVALDQDAESLTEIVNPSNLKLQTEVSSLREIIGGRFPGTDFDLVYAAGLFDYLEDRIAQRLVRRMLEAARPGGKVLVANFAPQISDRAYMEACMNWWLVYRTQQQVKDLFPGNFSQTVRCYTDPDANIEFAECSVPLEVGGEKCAAQF